MGNMFNIPMGPVAQGMCKLSMSGKIAVKTSNGYKVYNTKTGRLTNCSNFVFDIGSEFFFVIPTNKVKKGDIILVSGKPRCVVEVEKEKITVINYEDSTVETILPERHVFLGNTYFYGKIVSMFGNSFDKAKSGGMNNIMKYMMLSTMMKGGTDYTHGSANNGMSNLLPLMMFGNGGFENMFDGVFDFDMDLASEDEEENDGESEEEE